MASAELGITVTSTGVDKAVADLDKLAPAAQRAEQATAKMAQTTSANLSAVANQVDSFADRINKALNIKASGINIGRGEDIAAYGAELDRLKQKYNQAHAIMVNYRNEAAEIRRANQVGAISLNDMSNALDSLRAKTQKQIEVERQLREQRNQPGGINNPGRGGAAGGGGVSAGMQQFAQRDLMFQLQDIATTATMGMSPQMIAMQQGGQVAQALKMFQGGAGGVGGVMNIVKGLGTGLMALLDPITLVTMGVVGAGVAFYQWVSGAGEKVKTLDELMKEHAKTIQDLGKAYGFAGANVDKYMHQSVEFSQAAERKARDDLAKASTQAGRDLFGLGAAEGWRKYLPGPQTGALGAAEQRGPNRMGWDLSGGTEDIARGMEKFADPIRELREGIKAGNADWEKFAKSVHEIGEEQGLQKKADEILNLAKGAADAAEQVRVLKDAYKQLNDEANEMARLQIQQKDAQTDKQRIAAAKELAEYQNRNLDAQYKQDAVNRAVREVEADIARERRNYIQERQAGLDKMIKGEGDTLAAMKMTSTEADIYKQRQQAITDIYLQMDKAGVKFGDAAYEQYDKLIDQTNRYYDELQKIKEQEAAIDRERTRQSNDAQIQQMNATTNAQKVAAAGASARAGKVGAEADFAAGEAERIERARQAKEEADSVRSRNENLDRLATKQQEQISLIGKTAGEQAALSQQYELTYQLQLDAAHKGIEVSQTELDMIKKKTEEYGKLIDKENQLKLAEDLRFERSLIGMSKEEQAIAQRLRNTGLSTTGPEAQYMRETQRMQEVHDFAFDTGKDFLTSMSSAIVEGGDNMGESLIKAMTGAAQRTLDKVLDKLFDNILNSLLGTGAGAGGGGGGLAGGIASALMGGAGGKGGGAGFTPNTTLSAFLGAGGVAANSNVAGGGGSAAGGAVNMAMSLLGKNENANASSINSYLKAGGVDLNAAQTAWCAAFVNSSLKQVGIEGSGSNVASSFKGWGSAVSGGNVMAGDVLVKGIMGRTGGHVGIATGETRMGSGGLQYQMISGNTGGQGMGTGGVGLDWVSAASYEARRASDSMTKLTTATTKSVDSMTKLSGASSSTTSALGSMSSGFNSFGTALKTSSSAVANTAGGGSGGSGIFGWLANLFGGGGGGNTTTTSVGGGGGYTYGWAMGSIASPRIYHEGNMGASSRSAYFPSLAPWVDAPRFHNGGMFAADEFPAVLRRGEPVFPNVAAAEAFGGNKTMVNVHNYAGADVKTKSTSNSQGQTIDILVDKAVAQQIDQRGSASNNAIRGKFGVTDRLKLR